MNKFKKSAVLLLIITTAFIYNDTGIKVANAAVLTSLSDNLTRLAASTLADHEIKFVTPTGVGAGQAITLTFGSAFTLGTFNVNNEDFATGSTGNCVSATFTEQTLAASPSGATWGIGQASQVMTLTSGTGTVTAGVCVRFRIGANAVFGASGISIITNGTAGNANATVTVGGNFGDVGTLFVPIISNDQVSLTATVNPTMTFTLSQNSLGFGTLTTANGRWATNGGGAAVPTVGLVVSVATNGASGYSVYVLGATLTSGTNTIIPLAISTASSPGTSQFGINGAVGTTGSGSPSVTAPYGTSSQYAYTSTATTQTEVASNNAPDSGSTFNISYLANISGATPAGSYTATHTWTATSRY